MNGCKSPKAQPRTRSMEPTLPRRILLATVIALGMGILVQAPAQSVCTATFTVETAGGGSEALTDGYDFLIKDVKTITWIPAGDCNTRTANKIELYKRGTPDVLQWFVNISANEYTWSPVLRPSGSREDSFYFKVYFAGIGTTTAASNNFNILRFKVTAPAASDSYDEYGSMPIAWTVKGLEESENFNLELLKSDDSPCQTINQTPIHDSSYNWSPIQTCENAGDYKVKVTMIGGESEITPGFRINPCRISISSASTTPTLVHCSDDLDGKVLLSLTMKKDSGPSVDLTSLTFTVSADAGYPSLLTGFLQYRIGTGDYQPYATKIEATGEYTIQGLSVPITSSPTTLTIAARVMDNPDLTSASIALSIAENTDASFNYGGVASSCKGDGTFPVLGSNLVLDDRRPSPLSSIGGAPSAETVWCTLDASHPGTVALIPSFGEAGEIAYSITSITLHHASGVHFDDVSEVAVYKGETKLLHKTPAQNQTDTIILDEGTDISIFRGDPESQYQIVYFWKSAPPSSPRIYVPSITAVGTDAGAGYCPSGDPFLAIENVPGRSMTRSPSGALTGTLQPPNDVVTVCSDGGEVPALKANLSASIQDMDVGSMTFTATGVGANFSFFSSVRIQAGTWSKQQSDPGGDDELVVETQGLRVSKAAPVLLEVYLTPKATGFATEPSIQIQLSSVSYSGAITGNLLSDPCVDDYAFDGGALIGRTLQMRSKPDLLDDTYADFLDTSTCISQLTDVLGFRLSATGYGRESNYPYLSALEYDLAEGSIGDLEAIRLYKVSTPSDYVTDEGKDGQFDGVEGRHWTMDQAGTQFRIAVKPREDAANIVELAPRITQISALDPDGCPILSNEPDRLDATLRYKRMAELSVTMNPIQASGERSICSLAETEQPMVRLEMVTDGAERAELATLTLSCNSWNGITTVKAYSGNTLLGSTWNATNHRLEFAPMPVVDDTPYPIEIRFVFTSPTIDYGYRATLETGSASGEVTGKAPYSCGLLSWPPGLLTEPSTLVYRPGGKITRQLTAFPSDWTIPTTTALQAIAKSTLTISTREDISLTSVTYGDCLGGNRLDAFLSSNAQLWVGGQNLGGTAEVGQNIVFNPASAIMIPAGEPRNLELRGAFHLGWNDPGNGQGPKIKISAPILTAIGSKSGQACQTSIQVDPPSVACPDYGWKLEKIGTVIIEATSANADSLYCDKEGLALGFSLKTSQEETGTLSAVTVAFDDLDNCGTYTGRARLVLEDVGHTNGRLDPGEEDNNLSAAVAIVGGSASLPLIQPQQLSMVRQYFLVLAEIDYNSGCNNKRLQPHIDGTGIDAVGFDTHGPMKVDPPSSWQRRVTMIQAPALWAEITDGGGDVPMRPGEWGNVYTIGLTALCQTVTAGTLQLTVTNDIPNTIRRDIDKIKVILDGCDQHQEHEYDWLHGSAQDQWSQSISIPSVRAGCLLSVQVQLLPVGPNDVDIGDRDRIKMVVSGPLVVPHDTFEATVLYADKPIFAPCFQGCESLTPDPLVLPPDYPGNQEILIAKFCLQAGALNPGQTLQLSELRLPWDGNSDPSRAYQQIVCRVDGDIEVRSQVASPVVLTFTPPVGFSLASSSHSFEILAVTNPSATKSGSHQIKLAIDQSRVTFVGNPQWSCSGACSCDGRVVSFEDIARVEVCSCQPPGANEVVWGDDDDLDLYGFTLARATTQHSVGVEEITIPLEEGDASLFAGNLLRVRLYERAGGCGGARTEITSSTPPSFDPQGREITIPLDANALVLSGQSPRYFVIEITARAESEFENGAAFHFGLPQATATDLTVSSPASVSQCPGIAHWPLVKPRVEGWADLAGVCDKEDTGTLTQWLRFYRLDLRAQKEELTAKTFAFEFEDPTAAGRVDPSKDLIFFALFDEAVGDSLTQHVRWEPGTSRIDFPGFLQGKGVVPDDGAIHQWYLKLQVRGLPSTDNTNKLVELKNSVIPGNLKFTGTYTNPTTLTARATSVPASCPFLFGADRAVAVAHSLIQAGLLQPGATNVPVYQDTARVTVPGGGSLRLQTVRYALAQKPSSEQVLQSLQFELYRSVNGGSFQLASSGQRIGNEVVFSISGSQREIPAEGFAVFETRVSAGELDAGHKLQLAVQDCQQAYVATDLNDNQIQVTCAPAVGPVLTFAPGPCDVSAGRSRFEVMPSAVNSGIKFQATIVLRDGSGVLNQQGNEIPGIPLSSLRLTWSHDGGELSLTPAWTGETTDADGKATCTLTISDEIGADNTGRLLCSVGQTCEFAAENISILPGRPYAQRCQASGHGQNDTDFEICFALRDSLGNEINENHVTIVPGIPNPNPPDLANPTRSITPMCWTYGRTPRSGDVNIPVTVHPKNTAYVDVGLLFNDIRVPEHGLPVIDGAHPPTVTLGDDGRIHVTTLTASDANNEDADRGAFRAYLLLRNGWSDDEPDNSIVVRNEDEKDPSTGVDFSGNHDLPDDFADSGRSLDWRIAVADRDNNVAYYPADGFSTITHRIPLAEHRPAPSLTAKTDWRFFSIPDSFPGTFPGSPGNVFADMIATYGNPRQDRWVVADLIGHGGFSYYKREKMEGPELTEILTGRGYWVSGAGLGDQQTPFLSLESGVTQRTDSSRRVQVRIKDFTAIGNPFNFDLKSTALRRAKLRIEEREYPFFENEEWASWFTLYAPERFQSGSIDEVRYKRFGTETGFSSPDTWALDSWGAQYLWVANDPQFGDHETGTLVWDPPSPPAYQPSAPRNEDSARDSLAYRGSGPSDFWRIALTIDQSHEADEWMGLVLRARAGASDGLDVFDAPHPPEIDASAGVRLLSVPNEDATQGQPEGWLPSLDIDTRPAEAEPQVLDFYIENCGGVLGIAPVSWPQVTMPEGWSARIVDPIDQMVVDLGVASHIDINLLGSVGRHQLRLVIGPESRIEEALSKILPPIPGRTEILPACPNPCRKMTRIRFGVPAAAKVSLSIYDVRGHRIRNLLDGIDVPAGFRTEIWDGRNDRGTSVAAGIYWARVEALGASRQTQVTVLR